MAKSMTQHADEGLKNEPVLKLINKEYTPSELLKSGKTFK